MSASHPMTPIQAIQAFYQKRFDFHSRSRRSEFWWVQLAYYFIGMIAATIDVEFLGYSESHIAKPTVLLVEVALLIPLTSLTARRLHDVGLTGWAQLPTFILYIEYVPGYDGFVFGGLEKTGPELALALVMTLYLFWILFYLIKDGERGENRFGGNPKDRPPSDLLD